MSPDAGFGQRLERISQLFASLTEDEQEALIQHTARIVGEKSPPEGGDPGNQVRGSITELELIRAFDFELNAVASNIWISLLSDEDGEIEVELNVPQLDYARKLQKVSIERCFSGAGSLKSIRDQFIAQIVATDEDEIAFDDMGEPVFPLPPDQGTYIKVIENALRSIMRADGVIQGPCPRCGRESWLAKYRNRKKGGRPALEQTYCPSCTAEARRARWAGSKRRQRENQA